MEPHLESAVLRLRGREWQALSASRRERLVEDCFRYWRTKGFPYDRIDDEVLQREMACLMRTDSSEAWIAGGVRGSTAGLRSVNFFHPLMWSVRARDAYSPMQRFQCDRSLRRILQHALIIWPDKYSVNATNLRSMLRTFSKTTRVSNFRPTIAKAIIERYSSPGEQVIDFSAGYSGRLLGCIAARRRYLGVDPSSDQIQGGWALANALRRLRLPGLETLLYQGPAEEVLTSLPRGRTQLIFSSPPYFDRERYSEEPSQSYVRFPKYPEWKTHFLEVVIKECARILRPGGFLVINVSNVNRYRLADDTLEIASSVLRPFAKYSMQLARKPYLAKSSGPFKQEPLFVFRKV